MHHVHLSVPVVLNVFQMNAFAARKRMFSVAMHSHRNGCLVSEEAKKKLD